MFYSQENMGSNETNLFRKTQLDNRRYRTVHEQRFAKLQTERPDQLINL